jgi:hypothetical protein
LPIEVYLNEECGEQDEHAEADGNHRGDGRRAGTGDHGEAVAQAEAAEFARKPANEAD